MNLLAPLLLLAAAQSPAAEPLPAEIHNFNDWVVACDNGLRCEAVSLKPEPSTEGSGQGDPWERFGTMKLGREAGADAPLVITITDVEGTPARLVHYDSPLDARIVAGADGSWRVEPANLQDFLNELYSGTIQVQDAAGRTLKELALDGARGVMLYMDERQGRLRTPTALVRRGNRPASVVPVPPPLPVVTVAPATTDAALAIPAARLAEARRQLKCNQEEVGGPEEQSLHALGNGRTLIMMTCGAGAYNFSSMPLIAWREGSTIRIEPARSDLALEVYDETDNRFLVTNGGYDPATRTISGFAKGRGIGDCGAGEDFAWDGTRFRLVRAHAMSECRGTTELLTTYRAEIR